MSGELRSSPPSPLSFVKLRSDQKREDRTLILRSCVLDVCKMIREIDIGRRVNGALLDIPLTCRGRGLSEALSKEVIWLFQITM